MSNAGIQIGATRETIESLRDSIIAIATCSPFESVAIKALDTFTWAARTENVTLNGCMISVDQSTNEWADDEDQTDYDCAESDQCCEYGDSDEEPEGFAVEFGGEAQSCAEACVDADYESVVDDTEYE